MNQNEMIAARREAKRLETVKWVSTRFGVNEADVIGYNSGSCYDKAWVRTQEAADKIAAAVAGERANGGCFDGMPLGGISFYDGAFEVLC